MRRTTPLMLGAVAYDAKVVPIWEGFKAWFRAHDLAFDFTLYSNYEQQVEAQLAGSIDVAWNSPLAWIRARRLASARQRRAEAIVMRDTDQDLTSIVVVRAGSPLRSVADLRGRRVAVGAKDSPQATLLPLSHLRAAGLAAGDIEVIEHDLLGGKHGDHIGGERAGARALLADSVDATCMLDANHLLFVTEGTLTPGSTRILTQTPAFDHCNFTVLDGEPAGAVRQFGALLLGMRYDDPQVRPLLDMEGLKAWRPGRVSGYGLLERAVDEAGFYDARGNVTAEGYSW